MKLKFEFAIFGVRLNRNYLYYNRFEKKINYINFISSKNEY